MMHVLLTLIVIGVCAAQFATELHSISSCLSNCLECEYNDLDACYYNDIQPCIPNYHMDDSGEQCIIDPVYQVRMN